MKNAGKLSENNSSKVKQLTRESWIIAAIEILTQDGIKSVSILQLAKKLNITRGSFYHHFKNLEDLLESMLEYWSQKWTLNIKKEIDGLTNAPEARILTLIRLIRLNNANFYENAFRAWALHDPKARLTVKNIDEIRLSFLRGLFEEAGFVGIDADNRARLMIHYEICEPMLFTEQSKELEEQLIKTRHKLLMTPSG